MTEVYKAPFADENIVDKKGLATEQFQRLIEALTIVANYDGVFPFKRFADLAAVDLEFPKPTDGLTVIFTGQGLGTFNDSAGLWKLSADDTTNIT